MPRTCPSARRDDLPTWAGAQAGSPACRSCSKLATRHAPPATTPTSWTGSSRCRDSLIDEEVERPRDRRAAPARSGGTSPAATGRPHHRRDRRRARRRRPALRPRLRHPPREDRPALRQRLARPPRDALTAPLRRRASRGRSGRRRRARAAPRAGRCRARARASRRARRRRPRRRRCARSQLTAVTHQRSPGTRPGKPYSGIGVLRSLPIARWCSRNSAVTTAQIVWLPRSSGPVLQQPSR